MLTLLQDKETRKKILLIIAAMLLIRIGSVIPIPGIDPEYMKLITSADGLMFLNMVTGNSLSQMSIFALSITPYITASIIVQLFTIVIPYLEDLSKDGKTGREKLERINNIVGIGLAFIQSLFMAIGFGSKGLLVPYEWWMVVIATAIWTGGAALLMFIGNRITKLNLGNGISYILVCNILSTFPNDVLSLYEIFIKGKSIAVQITTGIIILLLMLAVIGASVFLTLSVRNIPITFSGKMYGKSQNQKLPIPLNTCSVMPIIFAGSLLSFPVMISYFFPDVHWVTEGAKYLSQAYWYDPANIKYTLGAVLYVALIYLFAMFYLNISFNTQEMANNLKLQGAMIPGLRPGKPTAEYLGKVSSSVALLGTTVMTLIIVTIDILCKSAGIGTLSIGGTSILICVSVIIEVTKQCKTLKQSVANQNFYKRKTSKGLF